MKSVDAAYRLKILPAPEYGKVKVSDFLVKKNAVKVHDGHVMVFLRVFKFQSLAFHDISNLDKYENTCSNHMNFKLSREAGAIQYQLTGP